MIKNLEIKTWEGLEETTIRIDCGLFSNFGQAEVIKGIVELISTWEKHDRKE